MVGGVLRHSAHRFRLYARTAATAAVRLASGYTTSRNRLKLERRATSTWSPDAIGNPSYREYPRPRSITIELSRRIPRPLPTRPISGGPPPRGIAGANAFPGGSWYGLG